MIIKDFEQKKSELRHHLKDYLSNKGRKIDGNSCQCPNGAEHKHDDQHMSCGITDDGTVFNCLGCGAKGDIFSAASYIDSKPLVGEEFVTENFMYLATMFNIHFELEDISLEEKQMQKVFLLYDRVKEILKLQYAVSKEGKEYAKKRGWEKLDSKFEFGFCDSYDKMIGVLEKEFDRPTMLKASIYHKDLFQDRFIIPIKDANGRVCGFGARSMEDKGRYVNSKTNLVYDKSSTLYNLNNAKRASTSVYLVEGFADCITMVKGGLENVAAVGGTSFAVKQYELLVRNRVRKIVLCFDNDEAGIAALDKALIKVIGSKKDVLVYIKEVFDAKDPDEFINKFGIEKFIEIPELTVFEWRLKKFSLEQTDEIRQQIFDDILNEESFIEKDRMCDKFAQVSNIKLETLQNEMKRLEVIKNEKLDITITDIVREESEFEKKINEYEEWVFNRKNVLLGMPCGFTRLTECLDGIQNGLYLIGGRPNIGKTCFNLQLIYNLVLNNDKVFALVWSIDDNLKKVIPRLISTESGIPINIVSNPIHKLKPEYGYTPEQIKMMLEQRETAVNKIKGLSKRLVIKDISSGNSIETIEKSVMTCRAITKTSDMQLVLVIDNFHKLSTEKYMNDPRSKFTYLSEQIKRIANVYDMPVLCTVELRKSDNIRPQEDDIKETVDLVYDADCIMLLHNEIHRVGEVESKVFFVDETGQKKPILEVDICKNKTSAFKGNLYFRFYSDLSRVVECEQFESRKINGIIMGIPDGKQYPPRQGEN